MKIVNRATQLVAVGVCMVAIAPAALAKAPSGFYLGGSVGRSTYDVSQQELDGSAREAFASLGRPVVALTSDYTPSDVSFSVIAGYRFLPYLSLEASYLDLGTAEYRSTESIASSPSPQYATLDFDLHTTGFTVAGIGSIPIGESFDVHARLGLFVNKTELKATAVVDSTGVATESLDSSGALVGVGAAFHVGEHVSVSFDWTRYANIGDENEDDDLGTTDGFDADAISVSATYKF